MSPLSPLSPPRCPPPPPFVRRALCVLVLVGLLPALSGCLTSPKAEAIRQQQLQEMGDVLNDMRVTLSTMAGTLDSLTTVVAKQDTTIARLANVSGVVVVK